MPNPNGFYTGAVTNTLFRELVLILSVLSLEFELG